MKTVEENYFRLLNYLLIKNYNNIWHVEKPISEQPKRGQPISGRPTDKIFLWEKRIGAASRARPAGEKITSNQIENNGPSLAQCVFPISCSVVRSQKGTV